MALNTQSPTRGTAGEVHEVARDIVVPALPPMYEEELPKTPPEALLSVVQELSGWQNAQKALLLDPETDKLVVTLSPTPDYAQMESALQRVMDEIKKYPDDPTMQKVPVHLCDSGWVDEVCKRNPTMRGQLIALYSTPLETGGTLFEKSLEEYAKSGNRDSIRMTKLYENCPTDPGCVKKMAALFEELPQSAKSGVRLSRVKGAFEARVQNQ